MPQSFGVYGEQKKGVQPWAQTLTLFPGGQNVSNFFSLYDSLGDVTLTGANTVPTILDGPEKVVRYDNLTIGDASQASSLTTNNRCKGLVVLCDTLTVRNNATLNMTGRGVRVDRNDDPYLPFIDFKIPFSVNLTSDKVSLATALADIRKQGIAPWDAGTFATIVSDLLGFRLSVNVDGSIKLIDKTGCPVGAFGPWSGPGQGAGPTGNAGSLGCPGSGGGGGIYNAVSGSMVAQAGDANPYSGGAGSGGVYNNWVAYVEGHPASNYSGPGSAGGAWYAAAGSTQMPIRPGSSYRSTGVAQVAGAGGAGNPGGIGTGVYCTEYPGANGKDGVGGRLVIIARTSITIQSGGKIEANGMSGGNHDGTAPAGGGGSGGGSVIIVTPSYSNSGTVQAAGGSGGTGQYASVGGAGGAGSVVTKTFQNMGW